MIRIAPQHGVAFQIKSGQRLKISSPQAHQVADLFCFSKARPDDALSSGRTIDYEDTFLFTTKNKLYSQQGFPLLEIEEDTAGRHDFLVTPCSAQMFQMLGVEGPHPSCLENLAVALRSFDIEESRIGTTFNVFMRIDFTLDGKITISQPSSLAGDFIVLRALEDLIIGLTACSDEGTNAGSCKPIDYLVY